MTLFVPLKTWFLLVFLDSNNFSRKIVNGVENIIENVLPIKNGQKYKKNTHISLKTSIKENERKEKENKSSQKMSIDLNRSRKREKKNVHCC